MMPDLGNAILWLFWTAVVGLIAIAAWGIYAAWWLVHHLILAAH
jgi:hypothetical protein